MMALDEIFTSFYHLEVVGLGDFQRNDKVRDLMLLLAQRIGSRVDIQKISVEMGVARQTLTEFLSFLEGTYFIRTIRPWGKGRDTEIRKMAKVYLCDSGLAARLARLEPGRLFENSIFQNLRQKGEVHYFMKKSGVEIDFILDGTKAYEVKTTPQNSDFSRLQTLTKELGIKQSRIISKNFSINSKVMYGFQI